MKKHDILNIEGKKVGDITLNEQIWGITPNDSVLYDALMKTRSALRQGTHDTKTRSEVSGGGRKPWRQKETGRARQGSTRATQWVKGGIAFGPHPRSYDKKQNRKERRLALKSALSYKELDNEITIVDSLNIESLKTKEMIKILANLKVEGKTLIVTDELTDNLILATRNLENVVLLGADEINTYDIIANDKLLITSKAIEKIEEVLV